MPRISTDIPQRKRRVPGPSREELLSYVNFKLNKMVWVESTSREVLESWCNMAGTEKIGHIKTINRGLDNVERWYRKTDDCDLHSLVFELQHKIATKTRIHRRDDPSHEQIDY
ncbi:hypothetical protein DFH06DRAFT_1128641 [Mycena polygramma]|nr:hypothetical protein DFH06DRAFT_1128641 [Mycena polygramma]